MASKKTAQTAKKNVPNITTKGRLSKERARAYNAANNSIGHKK